MKLEYFKTHERVRRRGLGAFSLTLLCFTLAGCQSAGTFNGSRVANEDSFSMTYSVLNQEETASMELNAGDSVNVEIDQTSGSISFSKATGNQEASADLIALMEKIRNNVETGTTGAYMTALEAACDILEWADRQSLSIAETNAVIMDWLGGLTPEGARWRYVPVAHAQRGPKRSVDPVDIGFARTEAERRRDSFSIQMEHVGNACTDLQTDRAEDLLSSIGKSADDVSWDSEDFDLALAITSCCGGTQ